MANCSIFAKKYLNMALATITVRVEPTLKKNFYALCEDFGLSVSSAINIFMKAVVREKKIPFEIKKEATVSINKNSYNTEDEIIEKGKKAFEEMRRIVRESVVEEPTLEEINAEIKAVRDGMSKK